MRALFNAALLFAGASSILESFVRYTCPNVAITSFLGVHAQEVAVPQTTISYFEQLPFKFHYFENSTVVLYLASRTGDVYISEDEAKTWSPVDGAPNGDADRLTFMEHPFDNRVAFILSGGTKHYTTRDRGRTWHSFNVPMPLIWGQYPPLSFHADPEKVGYVLYQGRQCREGSVFECQEETFYTKDGFSGEVKSLYPATSTCLFARSSKEFASQEHDDLIVCLAGALLASSDFFVNDIREVDFGFGPRLSKGIVDSISPMKRFLTATVFSLVEGRESAYERVGYVTADMKHWTKIHLPHTESMREYEVVGEMMQSLAVSTTSYWPWRIPGLFISDTNGTHYVESLKHMHIPPSRSSGLRSLQSLHGIAFVNRIENYMEVERDMSVEAKLQTLITYNNGASWNPLNPPTLDMHARPYECRHNRTQDCALHLHFNPQGDFNPQGHIPPTPPGFILSVGSVSEALLPYRECDMYLSRDAGKTWSQVRQGAHKYAFGDNGNIVVLVNDEEPTDHVQYSTDAGTSWQKMELGVTLRAHLLTTAPGATSQQFTLIGTLPHTHGDKKVVVVHLDFTAIQSRQCTHDDVEKWYAHGRETECIMGKKLWFWRRKSEADCYMGTAFSEPGEDMESCLCTDADFGCDYNHVLSDGQCIPLRPDSIPEGACYGDPNEEKYEVSSGYRLVPGNACKKEGGKAKDTPIMKSCTEKRPRRGEVGHQIFKFPSQIEGYFYFGSKTILVQSWSGIWKSLNEGFSWSKISLDTETYTSVLIHPYDESRAYLLTATGTYHYTTDAGDTWNTGTGPTGAKGYMMPELAFHPTQPGYLIWSDYVGCSYESRENCHVESYLSLDDGGNWKLIETYVERCDFAEPLGSSFFKNGIICASHRDKTGPQRGSEEWNPLEVTISYDWYETKGKLFDHIIGFENSGNLTFVASILLDTFSLDPYVSVDGRGFVKASFPPNVELREDRYNGGRIIVQSTQNSTFLQIIASDYWRAQWGTLLKSNIDGTFYGSSLDYVDHDMRRELDYYPMPGIDGVALANVVTNPKEAVFTGKKKVQTRITHNDGGSWSPLNPPERDSYGATYPCNEPPCSLHLQSHNATSSYGQRLQRSPTLAGLMMGVGNVGKIRSPYRDSDMFLTRNGGLTWEEVHKGTHIWEIGDSGSILVMASDERPVDHIKYSIDDGAHWTEYNFGTQIWVKGLYTSPKAMSRKFTLLGSHSHPMDWRTEPKDVVIYFNFAELTGTQCRLWGFEIWDPSAEPGGKCLLGAVIPRYRLKKDSHCYIGDLVVPSLGVVRPCVCTDADFECEYNHVRNAAGDCVLIPGAVPLPSEEICTEGDVWYERTEYRKIAKSMCTGGTRPDRGTWHYCRGHWLRVHATLLWSIAVAILLAIMGGAFWYYKRRNSRKGPIHLPDGDETPDVDMPSMLTSLSSSLATGFQRASDYIRNISIPRPGFLSRRANQGVSLGEDTPNL
ncbi:hypothetical protein M408DRAFT_266851 [Serendipita vermifera MAFF 305830]|uniref:VPS10 domain-containing protein n=1 Tax=Serendipita vermifera MAFF 305830 TaxID=933852 RepID=A0A0C2X0L5_SERVB|nr:hypothetical protein M408DRAFT_266851 [Serendipita vermifera MAFF 305830]